MDAGDVPGRTIASRRLTLVPSGRPVDVELDAPVRRRTGQWACAYRIRGIGRVRAGHAQGEDGFQALQLAFSALRRALEPFAAQLTWTGEPGELGLPEPIPDYFGGEFRRRLERLVRQETEREAQRLKDAALAPTAPQPGARR
jgi:uncharacterized protein DUF6968